MIFSDFCDCFTRALPLGLMLATLSSPLLAAEKAWVTEINAAGHLLLKDGREVVPAGTHVPEQARGEATHLLDVLVQGKEVKLASVEEDRYGRPRAQIYSDAGWLQGELLRQGWALACTLPGEKAAELLAAEREARKARRGLWADNRVIAAEEAQTQTGRFAIIEGTVQEVAERKNGIYLNFGADWKTDFTLFIARGDARRFKGMDFLSLKGRKIEARGWVQSRNGPFIALSDPGQIEMAR